MALQIANPAVVAKVAELAALTGLSKTAAVYGSAAFGCNGSFIGAQRCLWLKSINR